MHTIMAHLQEDECHRRHHHFEFLLKTCEGAVNGRTADFCLGFFIRIYAQIVNLIGSLYKRTTPFIYKIVQRPSGVSVMSLLQEENPDCALKNITTASAVESRTLVIKGKMKLYPKPTAYAPSILTRCAFCPRKLGGDGWGKAARQSDHSVIKSRDASPNLVYLSTFCRAAQVSLHLLRGDPASQEQRSELSIVY